MPTHDEFKSAVEAVRIVLNNLPITFAVEDLCPADHLMHALGVLQAALNESKER